MHLLKTYKRLRQHRLCGSPVLISGYTLLLGKLTLHEINANRKICDHLSRVNFVER